LELFWSSWQAAAMVSVSVRLAACREPRSRRVCIRRWATTSSVSSLTTHSIPTTLPSSSKTGL
jgi:hypothetical protein